MEWRDIAMSLLGFLLGVVWWTVTDMKAEMKAKTNNSDHDETKRRVTDSERNIGDVFSKLHDEEVDRLKSNMEIVVMQNKNQSALLSTLASVTSRINGQPNGNGNGNGT